MTAKELERLFNGSGVGVAKLDAVTRKLRAAGHLPKGGRGPNAPQIGAREAALFLIAIAGSSKGNEADVRVEKLLQLSSKTSRRVRHMLLDAVEQLLSEPDQLAQIAELRVGRTTRFAAIHSTNGKIEEFVQGERDTRADRFSVEGIIPRSLLERIAVSLAAVDAKDTKA